MIQSISWLFLYLYLLDYKEASEPKWVNSDYIHYGVNSFRMEASIYCSCTNSSQQYDLWVKYSKLENIWTSLNCEVLILVFNYEWNWITFVQTLKFYCNFIELDVTNLSHFSPLPRLLKAFVFFYFVKLTLVCFYYILHSLLVQTVSCLSYLKRISVSLVTH